MTIEHQPQQGTAQDPISAVEPPAPTVAAEREGPDPALFANRELSWMDFNDRVLQLAEDPTAAAPGAREVRRDLDVEPRRVLHGAGGRAPRPGRGRRARAARRPPLALADDRRHPRARRRAVRARARAARALAAPRARRARHQHRRPRRRVGRGPRGAPGALPAPDLPGADAAGGRAGPAVPVHLQPVAVPRGPRARPDDVADDVRPREGAEGDAAALRARRGRGGSRLRPARGPHRQQPARPLPGDGDPRPRLLPRDARRRPRGVRRGRRPAARGGGGAAPPALRRGGPRRGRVRHRSRAAQPAHGGARRRGAPGLRRPRHHRPQRPLADRQAARSPGAARHAVVAGDAAAPAAGGGLGHLRGDPPRRHPRPPPLRLVLDLGRAVRAAGVGGPRRPRDQDDRVPHVRRHAPHPGADPGDGERQAGRVPRGAQGALRRAGEHRLGEGAGGGGGARRLRPPVAEDAREVRSSSSGARATACATTCTSGPATTT